MEIDKVSFAYAGGETLIDGLSLRMAPGEVVVVTGPSGSGKTTLTRLVNGLLPHFFPGSMTGQVRVNGEDLAILPTWERGRLIGSVFQDPRSQFFADEVTGEIAFGCENYGFTHSEIVERVHRTAEDLRISELLARRLRGLSYGMRQKVAIASAHAIGPQVLVLDEPSANLDLQATDDLRHAISEMKYLGKTVLISEHRLYYLMDIADRVICLDQGQVVGTYTPTELKQLAAAELTQMGLRMPSIDQLEASFIPDSSEPKSETRPALEARELTRRFGDLVALDKVELRLNRGEIVAIVGPNGAGKSVLGRVLSGLTRPNSGTVHINGRRTNVRRRRNGVWYIGQDLDSQLFGESVLTELLTGGPDTPESRARATEILAALGLFEYAERHPATLSGGQKQRLLLGVAMMREAPVIILDEPTSGLDGNSMRRVSEVFRQLAARGHALLLISHDAECILECCQRIIRMEKGRITDDLPLANAAQMLQLMGYQPSSRA